MNNQNRLLNACGLAFIFIVGTAIGMAAVDTVAVEDVQIKKAKTKNRLLQSMDAAVKEERYEDAAVIRDYINKFYS